MDEILLRSKPGNGNSAQT